MPSFALQMRRASPSNFHSSSAMASEASCFPTAFSTEKFLCEALFLEIICKICEVTSSGFPDRCFLAIHFSTIKHQTRVRSLHDVPSCLPSVHHSIIVSRKRRALFECSANFTNAFPIAANPHSLLCPLTRTYPGLP